MTAVRKTWAWMGSPAAGRAITMAMILYLVALGWLYRMQASLVECQASYAEASAASTAARTEAAAQDREVLDTLISAIANATSRDETQRALGAYQRTRTETDLYRKEHPLPAPPSTRC